MKTCVLLCALGVLCSDFDVRAAEWSRFRGPDGAGLADAPTVPASPTEKDFAWTAKLPGKGHSSPIAWGQKIFVTAEDASKPGVRYVLCFDALTGKELWRYEDKFEAYHQHEFNSYAASTPAADADRVYISWLVKETERHVLALDHSGKRVWEKTLGFYKEEHGGAASPVVVDGLLIVPNDHCSKTDAGIFALDVKTGAVKWKVETDTPKTAFSTPLVITGPDGKKQLVFSSNPAALTAVDPATGKKLWEYQKSVPQARAVGSPILADGVIVATIGQGGGGMSAIAVRPGSSDGKVKPELVWEADKHIPYVPTPVAVGKDLFFLGDGGMVSCLHAATGERVWEERGPGKAYSSPVCVNGHLYTLGRDGALMVVNATEKFESLGQVQLGEECQTTPAVAAGRLIVRTNTKLIAIGGGGASAAKP